MPRRKRKNIDKIEKEQIKAELLELRVKQGFSTTTIIKHLEEKYDMAEATAYKYLKEVKQEMTKHYDEIKHDALADSIYYLENLLEKAMMNEQHKTALEIQKELNKVNQLYIEQKQIEIKTEKPLFFGPDNIDGEL